MSIAAKTLHFIWWQGGYPIHPPPPLPPSPPPPPLTPSPPSGWADADHSIPDDARDWVTEWQLFHPTFAVQRWDEASFFQVVVPRVESAFPNLREVVARLHAPVEKVDLARWVIVYAFGGVYLDCDMRCMKGVSELYDDCFRNDSIFLAKEPGGCLNNAIICCTRPSDSVVHAICMGLLQRILTFSSASDWPGTLVATGPIAITSIITSNQLLAGRLKVESKGPLVFGAGAKVASVRSAKSPSDVSAGTIGFVEGVSVLNSRCVFSAGDP